MYVCIYVDKTLDSMSEIVRVSPKSLKLSEPLLFWVWQLQVQYSVEKQVLANGEPACLSVRLSVSLFASLFVCISLWAGLGWGFGLAVVFCWRAFVLWLSLFCGPCLFCWRTLLLITVVLFQTCVWMSPVQAGPCDEKLCYVLVKT